MTRLEHCRQALDVPVLLCLWHATKAWLEQIRNKLVNKQRCKEAFDTLHDIMYLKATGTLAQRCAAVDAAIEQFKETFSDEPEVIDWFELAWEKKRGTNGATDCLKCLGSRVQC